MAPSPTTLRPQSVVMDTLGFDVLRDVDPGEAVFFDSRSNSMSSKQCFYDGGSTPQLVPCIFEYVYFARPDSVMDGVSVYESRVRMGRSLARRVQQVTDWREIDVVIPIPDTSRTTAIETAYILQRPLREAFQKNRYIARTFIMPGQQKRRKTMRLKLNTIRSEFKDTKVLLVDDSIVRGTTCNEIIQMAREAGASKVFFASAAPAVRFPNVYGIDLPRKEDLIANGRDEGTVAKLIGADWVVYQDLNDLVECVRGLNPERLRFGFDASVFDGKYITGDIDHRFFEQQSRREEPQTPSLSVPIGVSQSVSELDEQVLDHLSGPKGALEMAFQS
ncbi:purF [Symbiodinium sp. CCMP2592]|nr:purF [Symbiodinium sp. CCMP2592]